MRIMHSAALLLFALCLVACGTGIEEKIGGKWQSNVMNIVINTKDKTIFIDMSKAMSGMMGELFGKSSRKMMEGLIDAFVSESDMTSRYEVKKISGNTIVLNVIANDGSFDEMILKMPDDNELLVMENDKSGLKLTRVK